jgi:hypothetical protein
MTRFWLATFEVAGPAADSAGVSGSGDAASQLALDILNNGDEWAVLFSIVDNVLEPAELRCFIGFTNAAKACNVWHDRGFPLVDAKIGRDGDVLRISSPCFRQEPAMQYESEILAISGIDFESSGVSAADFTTSYCQELRAPDAAQPDTVMAREGIVWGASRTDPRQLGPNQLQPIDLGLSEPALRAPSLAPLRGSITPAAAWSGATELPASPQRNRAPLVPLKTADRFGVPAFRFEDVEVLGFRVDLGQFGLASGAETLLAKLIQPLNFHLPAIGEPPQRNMISDFRFRPATRTLVIELLRYNRMKAKAPLAPLTAEDCQSQHELLVRILVGRVDDDTAQAHDPAVYVPAIFVDNPWSKMLGRELLGYDKRMAQFCFSSETPLLPNGRRPAGQIARSGQPSPAAGNDSDDEPVPLGEISRVNLVGTTGAVADRPLLDLAFASANHTDADALQPVDLDLVLGSSVLTNARWRQSDFDDAEFRRSFASLAVSQSVRAFRSIQVAPIGNRDLDKTWVTGTFSLDDSVRFALPDGMATLTLHAAPPRPSDPSAPSAPAAWNLLCEVLGDGEPAEIKLVSGSWYRLSCSMELTLDDDLNWGRSKR